MLKMQNNQVYWPAARMQLGKKLKQYKDRPRDLAREADINYFSARRFILNGVHNRSRNVEKLCNLFGINVSKNAKMQIDSIGALTGLLRNVWDGTDAHAQLIGKLIESTKPFRVEDRAKKRLKRR